MILQSFTRELPKKSFSIVELMVIVTIISILSTLAYTSFKIYTIKSRIAATVPILNHIIDTAIENYNANGAVPNPLSVYGTSIACQSASYAALSLPPVKGMLYNQITGANSFYVCIYLSDIGIPGWVDNAGNDSGTYNRICMSANIKGDSFTKACGIWGEGQSMDVPTKYLPGGCNCARVGDFAWGGVICAQS